MSANSKPDELRLGFLTASEIPGGGYVGGLLVTNRYGRPLEFQCTSPVQPNRMQEILYGHTLNSYVLVELIGTTLLQRIGTKPDLVLTEKEQLLELREHVAVPVALVITEPQRGAQSTGPIAEPQEPDPSRLNTDGLGGDTQCTEGSSATIRIGRQRLRLHAAHSGDCATFESRAVAMPEDADLHEPFQRVREALDEATRESAVR